MTMMADQCHGMVERQVRTSADRSVRGRCPGDRPGRVERGGDGACEFEDGVTRGEDEVVGGFGDVGGVGVDDADPLAMGGFGAVHLPLSVKQGARREESQNRITRIDCTNVVELRDVCKIPIFMCTFQFLINYD